MRRIVLLSLFAILVTDACAQRRGGMGPRMGSGFAPAFSRGSVGFARARYVVPYGYGNGYGYSGYDGGGGYAYVPQPMLLVVPQMQPEPVVEAPPREVHPVVIDYKRSAGDGAATAAGEPQTFGIVLKDGETLNATTVVAEGDALHYVDLDERNMRVALTAVDRDATRKLNAERKLVLHIPVATQASVAVGGER